VGGANKVTQVSPIHLVPFLKGKVIWLRLSGEGEYIIFRGFPGYPFEVKPVKESKRRSLLRVFGRAGGKEKPKGFQPVRIREF